MCFTIAELIFNNNHMQNEIQDLNIQVSDFRYANASVNVANSRENSDDERAKTVCNQGLFV